MGVANSIDENCFLVCLLDFPPGRIQMVWDVPGLLWRSLGSSRSQWFPQGVLGSRRVSPRFSWASLGSLGGVPRRLQVLLREGPGGTDNRGFLSVCWGLWGPLSVILVVWSGPRDRPGRYILIFSWFSLFLFSMCVLFLLISLSFLICNSLCDDCTTNMIF